MGFEQLEQNSMVKKICNEKYDVDIFACVDAYFNEDSKGSLRNIVQPGTRIRDKVKDTIMGKWKNKTEEIFTYKDLNDMYNKKDLSTLPEVFEILGFDMDVVKYHQKPETDETMEETTDMTKEQAEILINGLNNLVVHNYAKRSANKSTLFALFTSINGLKGITGVDDEYMDMIYDKVKLIPGLTEKARPNFNSTRYKLCDKSFSPHYLQKMVKLTNEKYYKEVFLPTLRHKTAQSATSLPTSFAQSETKSQTSNAQSSVSQQSDNE
ncbi:MAG: hypothetical protein EZS28_036645, partial [Streblomastix strix]